MSDPVLKVQQLSKEYVLGRQRPPSLGRDIATWGKRLLRGGQRARGKIFHALKEVSFELERGDILGIIGRNGAGKSTLLKILAEVTAPTSGRIEFNGTVTSILDIGTGFHPDLTGRQNVFLAAALTGMDKQLVRERFDEIHTFSGIGEYIDQPVKHYSSGMYLRLAFSVAFHTEMDILLLDEVLSVGDVDFRHRSTQRIKEIAERGTTILLVSHELPAVRSICNKCLFLHRGEVVAFGPTQEIVDDYLHLFYEKVTRQYEEQDDKSLMDARKESAEVKYEETTVRGMGKKEGEALYMEDGIEILIDYTIKQHLPTSEILVNISNYAGGILFDSRAYRPGFEFPPQAPGDYQTIIRIPPNLLHAGSFFVNILFATQTEGLLELPYAKLFNVEFSPWEKDANWNKTPKDLPLRPRLEWEVHPR